MGRTGEARDDVGNLLRAVGNGDGAAFAAFYDRTAPLIFNRLCRALGEPAAEPAMVRVYARVWRTASSFDSARMSGCAFLTQAMYRELDRRSAGSQRLAT